jgi:hypothetical protein
MSFTKDVLVQRPHWIQHRTTPFHVLHWLGTLSLTIIPGSTHLLERPNYGVGKQKCEAAAKQPDNDKMKNPTETCGRAKGFQNSARLVRPSASSLSHLRSTMTMDNENRSNIPNRITIIRWGCSNLLNRPWLIHVPPLFHH